MLNDKEDERPVALGAGAAPILKSPSNENTDCHAAAKLPRYRLRQ